VQPRALAVHIWFCLAQPGRARILPVAGTPGSRWVRHPSSRGGGESSIPSMPSRRGGPLPSPRQKGGGSMPGSCAGDGGCSGGRQRLSTGLIRVKAGRQRLGRHSAPPILRGLAGPLKKVLWAPVERERGGVPKAKQIGTAGVVHISLLGVKSYDQGKMN